MPLPHKAKPALTRKRHSRPRAVTLPQEPSLIRPFRIPLHSLFACFLFCVPTFALTLFVLVTAEATQLYIVLGLMSSGLCVWSVLANTLQQRARLHVLGCALQFLNRRLASRFARFQIRKHRPCARTSARAACCSSQPLNLRAGTFRVFTGISSQPQPSCSPAACRQ